MRQSTATFKKLYTIHTSQKDTGSVNQSDQGHIFYKREGKMNAMERVIGYVVVGLP